MEELLKQEARLNQEYLALLTEREALTASTEACFDVEDKSIHTYLGGYSAAKKRNDEALNEITSVMGKINSALRTEDRQFVTVKRNYQNLLRHLLPQYLDDLRDYKETFVRKKGREAYKDLTDHRQIDILLRMNRQQLIQSVDYLFDPVDDDNDDLTDSDVTSPPITVSRSARQAAAAPASAHKSVSYPSPRRSARGRAESPVMSHSRQMQLSQRQHKEVNSARTLASSMSLDTLPSAVDTDLLESSGLPLASTTSTGNITSGSADQSPGKNKNKRSRSMSLTRSIKSIFSRKSKK